MEHTKQESWEDYFDEWESMNGTHLIIGEECRQLVKSFIRQTLATETAKARESVIDYIRAEGEWVKEDAPDGNYGYFRADEKLLEAARTQSVEGNK